MGISYDLYSLHKIEVDESVLRLKMSLLGVYRPTSRPRFIAQ